MTEENDKELVSAEKRRFMVAIQPKHYSKKGAQPQTVIVEAFSLAQAERIAVRKMKTGKFKNQKCWQITYCEEIGQ